MSKKIDTEPYQKQERWLITLCFSVAFVMMLSFIARLI